jgi:hypothetical protein
MRLDGDVVVIRWDLLHCRCRESGGLDLVGVHHRAMVVHVLPMLLNEGGSVSDKECRLELSQGGQED